MNAGTAPGIAPGTPAAPKGPAPSKPGMPAVAMPGVATGALAVAKIAGAGAPAATGGVQLDSPVDRLA